MEDKGKGRRGGWRSKQPSGHSGLLRVWIVSKGQKEATQGFCAGARGGRVCAELSVRGSERDRHYVKERIQAPSQYGA